MSKLSPSFEKTRMKALKFAHERHHEYALAEHLLLALLDDVDAIAVIEGCGANVNELRIDTREFVDAQLSNLVTGYDEDPTPSTFFKRVIQRAVIHVQSSGREEVTGADALVSIFAERKSNAASILNKHGLKRLEVVNFIANGKLKSEEPSVKDDSAVSGPTDEMRFSSPLERALHQALTFANERHHEFATLEHFLLALLDDADVGAALEACGANLRQLRRATTEFIDHELDNLITDSGDDSKPTSSFQRVIQRAVINVQSSGRQEVMAVNAMAAIFAERETRAAHLLSEHGLTRYDLAKYIAETGGAPLPSAGEFEAEHPEQKNSVAEERSAAPPFIFLSYASPDRERVRDIRSMLMNAGLPIWWDQDIAPGDQWRNEIHDRLEEAAVVLTLWTSSSVKSDAVKAEASRAQAVRRFVHVRMDGSEVPYGYAETQYVEMQDWDGAPTHPKFRRLVQALRDKIAPPSKTEIRRRLSLNSPISAGIRQGKLVQLDRPEYVLPTIDDRQELHRRLASILELTASLIGMAEDRNNFQAHPGAIHSLRSIQSAASMGVPTWYSLEDSAYLLEICLEDSDAACSWNGTLYHGAKRVLSRIQEIRKFLEPRQIAGSMSGSPPVPLATINVANEAEVSLIAEEVRAAFVGEDAQAVIGADLQESAARAVDQIRDAGLLSNSNRRFKRLAAATTKLAYVVGAVATASAGGVATSLLTAPEAAATLAARLQPIFERLLSLFS